ncbi:hypothetical protein D0Y65_033978 [Glycine soja]|uniref:Uncharacterized protein n=1 Tax=Glycine soja TaxID=3848 RepID=A0A445HNG1_GLYSO|nr:hypothetical protein D0Y65_033978 [Glycine soja]
MEQPDIQSLSLEDEEEMLFSKEAVTTKGLNYSLCLVGSKLFKLDKDDGERAWGPKIPADPRSSAMAGRSQYLREGGQ